MTQGDFYQRLLYYKSALAQAKILLAKGILLPNEYAIIDTKMREKYGINSCSIFVEKDLIINDYRGNIPLTEEVE